MTDLGRWCSRTGSKKIDVKTEDIFTLRSSASFFKMSTPATRVLALLKRRYGDHNLAESHRTSDASPYWTISKELFLSKFTDAAIRTFAANHWSGATITLDEIVTFFRSTVVHSTKSRAHEYVDYWIAVHGLPISDGFPIYHRMPEAMVPRPETTVTWAIDTALREAPLTRAFYDVIDVRFNVMLGPRDDRFYDIVLSGLGIVIEVQENSVNHRNCPNDLLKEKLAQSRGYRVLYFKIADYSARQTPYWVEFKERMLAMVQQALLARFMAARENYLRLTLGRLLSEEKNRLKVELKMIPKTTATKEVREGLKNRIESFSEVFDDLKNGKNETLIAKMFQARSGNVLKIEEIATLLAKDIKDVRSETNLLGSGHFRWIHEDNDFARIFSWSHLIEYCAMTRLCRSKEKEILYFYLSKVGDMYEDILAMIQEDNRDRLQSLAELQQEVQLHLEKKIETRHLAEKNKLERELAVAEELNAISLRKSDLIYKSAERVIRLIQNKVTNRKERQLLETLEQEKASLEEIVVRNKPRTYTVQMELKKSIIKELPDFPIRYGRLPRLFSGVTREAADAVFEEWKIPERTRRQVYKYICYAHSNTTLTDLLPACYLITNHPFYRDLYAEEIKATDSESESDTETESEGETISDGDESDSHVPDDAEDGVEEIDDF